MKDGRWQKAIAGNHRHLTAIRKPGIIVGWVAFWLLEAETPAPFPHFAPQNNSITRKRQTITKVNFQQNDIHISTELKLHIATLKSLDIQEA